VGLAARGVVINNRPDTNHMEEAVPWVDTLEAAARTQVVVQDTLYLALVIQERVLSDTQVVGALIRLAAMQLHLQLVTKQVIKAAVIKEQQLIKEVVDSSDISLIREI